MYQSDIFPGESFSSSCAVSNESSNEQLQANGHIEFIEMFITDRAAEVVAKSLGVSIRPDQFGIRWHGGCRNGPSYRSMAAFDNTAQLRSAQRFDRGKRTWASSVDSVHNVIGGEYAEYHLIHTTGHLAIARKGRCSWRCCHGSKTCL
jgi:hypothetical protein